MTSMVALALSVITPMAAVAIELTIPVAVESQAVIFNAAAKAFLTRRMPASLLALISACAFTETADCAAIEMQH